MKGKSALVVSGGELSRGELQPDRHYDVVIAPLKLRQELQMRGAMFVPIEPLIGAGSIHEADALLKELSYVKRADGTRVASSVQYKGYELWWIHYENLFRYSCLPYTQYKELLTYIKDFQEVHWYRPPYANLFALYLQAYGSEMRILKESGSRSPSLLPFGILLQIGITLASLPSLMLYRRRFMVYIGDKFEKGKDYDFRMKFIYEELRQKNLPFIECIRSLESWRVVVQHALIRRRPVIYSEAVLFFGRFASVLSGGRYRARRMFGIHTLVSDVSETDPENHFKLLVANQYLRSVSDDIWAIRIMAWLLRAIGIKVAHITAASERSFHAVLGCKLDAIPTVGIQHGVTPRHYAVDEFMEGFDGEKSLSVDRYGLWSEGWRQYFLTYSKAYKPEQLHVSGSMRPLQVRDTAQRPESIRAENGGPIRVLFISEQLAAPEEVMPYLVALLEEKGFSVHLKIRPYRDGFEDWLRKNHPEILCEVSVVRGDIHEATSASDVVVGSHSTAVLEAVSQLKPFIFFQTKKWGDYFEVKALEQGHSFFAENPEELLVLVRGVKQTSQKVLQELQQHFLGDPYRNGSAWVVEQMEELLSR